jgi:hypothetical protein
LALVWAPRPRLGLDLLQDSLHHMPSNSPGALSRYSPPFDVTADTFFCLALCPTAPLRHSFRGVPFLSLFGRTPLVIWFSRVTEACETGPNGRMRCERETENVPYDELNVMAALRQRAVFVPAIYADRELSIRIGHTYGLPKKRKPLHFAVKGNRLESHAADVPAGTRRSFVRARLFGSGRLPAKLLSWLWPLWSWPVRTPAGTQVRARIDTAPRLQPALIRAGQVSLDESWLPKPLPIVPLALYVPQLRFHLPPP